MMSHFSLMLSREKWAGLQRLLAASAFAHRTKAVNDNLIFNFSVSVVSKPLLLTVNVIILEIILK